MAEPPLAARLQRFECELMELVERNGTVAELFCAMREAMTKAEMTVRAPNLEKGGGYCYVWQPDHAIRLAAARTLAQILRLMPQSAGVTVNNNPQTVNITAADRLAELDSIGVSREQIAQGCQDLLAATEAEKGPAKIT